MPLVAPDLTNVVYQQLADLATKMALVGQLHGASERTFFWGLLDCCESLGCLNEYILFTAPELVRKALESINRIWGDGFHHVERPNESVPTPCVGFGSYG